MNWIDYREKLGIGFSDREKSELFFVKIENALRAGNEVRSTRMGLTPQEYITFCNMVGERVRTDYLSPSEHDNHKRFREILDIVYKSKDKMFNHSLHKNNIRSFISYYIAFVNASSSFQATILMTILRNALTECGINFEVLVDWDGYFVFPKGAEEMDNALVSQTYAWLVNYPNAHTAYSEALKEYTEATADNARDIAYKFRKVLETFFQEFFECSKSLENCKAEYGKYLDARNVPKEITANFETLLQSYTNFMNSYAKNHDKTGLNILEYIMYQTGNIIRLLVTLKNSETT